MMKSLEQHTLLVSCFPSVVTAGITYKSFFTPAYSKQTGGIFKAKLATKLQRHYRIKPQLLTQVHGIRILSHTTNKEKQDSLIRKSNEQEPFVCNDVSTLYPEADGHYTLQKDFCLGILVADCAGVLIHDVNTGYNAAIHSGWKGTAHNIIGTCIQDAQQKRIAYASSLIAWISPCARACCYEVGDEVADCFISSYPTACYYSIQRKKYTLDIACVIKTQLETSGLMPQNIHTAPICTICSKHFHSYRRDGDHSGRCLVFITCGTED